MFGQEIFLVSIKFWIKWKNTLFLDNLEPSIVICIQT